MSRYGKTGPEPKDYRRTPRKTKYSVANAPKLFVTVNLFVDFKRLNGHDVNAIRLTGFGRGLFVRDSKMQYSDVVRIFNCGNG